MAAVSRWSCQDTLATTYPGDRYLSDQTQEVAQSQFVVLLRQGGYGGVLPAQVDEQEGRTEGNKLVLRFRLD
jgi:hypothetical protein